MAITLDGTNGITTPDVIATSQSSNFVTTGNISAADLTLSGAASAADLTLSGGVYLGGTGAANYLDDYEEGSFSPLISDGTNTAALGVGKYTKIGRSVSYFIQAYNVNISSLSASAHLRITGFPFTFQAANPVYANSLFSQREPEVTGLAEGNYSYLLLYKGESDAVNYGLFTRNVWGGTSSATFRGQFIANID